MNIIYDIGISFSKRTPKIQSVTKTLAQRRF